MKHDGSSHIEQILKDLPSGELTIARHFAPGPGRTLLTDQLSAKTSGKGTVETYVLLPGIEASFNAFLAPEITFRHGASETVLELYYCQSSRVGWNMRGGTAVYLGAGDVTAHSMACCADSVMMFPLGYSEGISLSVDLGRLDAERSEILRQADVQAKGLQEQFCSGGPIAIPACPELEHIFAPLCAAAPALRLPLLKLKVQELLIYLSGLAPDRRELTQYVSQQTELIKEIHQLLTEHLDRRFTIEELSRRYLINTSTLKEVFKAVYGQPIATYMKGYRIQRAMELLRDTDATIADIAAQVGLRPRGSFLRRSRT